MALAFVGLLFVIYYEKFSTRLYINPLEYTKFKKISSENISKCDAGHEIEYFRYKSVPEGESRNNKFGLYIYPDNEKFIELADRLVNSNGGDWGYVLIPFNVKDTNEDKWNRLFYLLNKKHLIPVIQLYDVDLEDYEDQTKEAAEFLNERIWPIRQRYVSVYNEPNDANFWYGKVDPAEYARVLDFTVRRFKEVNQDFFMMNAGFNVSAPNGNSYMDSFTFMQQMNEEIPGIFDRLDGWASHPYPQPNFGGSPSASGRWSIRAYEDELAFLHDSLGVEKELPVFITETGWAHDAGKTYNSSYLSLDEVSDNYEEAYEKVWLPDDRVVAVMPFTVWYESPGDHFSWVDSRSVPYQQYEAVKSMKKTEGNPESLETAKVTSEECPN